MRKAATTLALAAAALLAAAGAAGASACEQPVCTTQVLDCAHGVITPKDDLGCDLCPKCADVSIDPVPTCPPIACPMIHLICEGGAAPISPLDADGCPQCPQCPDVSTLPVEGSTGTAQLVPTPDRIPVDILPVECPAEPACFTVVPDCPSPFRPVNADGCVVGCPTCPGDDISILPIGGGDTISSADAECPDVFCITQVITCPVGMPIVPVDSRGCQAGCARCPDVTTLPIETCETPVCIDQVLECEHGVITPKDDMGCDMCPKCADVSTLPIDDDEEDDFHILPIECPEQSICTAQELECAGGASAVVPTNDDGCVTGCPVCPDEFRILPVDEDEVSILPITCPEEPFCAAVVLECATGAPAKPVNSDGCVIGCPVCPDDAMSILPVNWFATTRVVRVTVALKGRDIAIEKRAFEKAIAKSLEKGRDMVRVVATRVNEAGPHRRMLSAAANTEVDVDIATGLIKPKKADKEAGRIYSDLQKDAANGKLISRLINRDAFAEGSKAKSNTKVTVGLRV